MTPIELIAARSRYNYVPGRLIASTSLEPELICRDLHLVHQLPSHQEWNTAAGRSQYASIELDGYHTKLLNGKTVADFFHGLLSVIFWGYVSGMDGRFRVNRAISKAKIVKNGRGSIAPQRPAEILECLRHSRRRLMGGDIQGALLKAMNIKFLGMSFASKVLMFMNPSAAVVYDSIIARHLTNSADSKLRQMAVSTGASTNKELQASAYRQWCSFCVETASSMNQAGHLWTDWDGTKHSWRAVDVERAFFAAAG